VQREPLSSPAPGGARPSRRSVRRSSHIHASDLPKSLMQTMLHYAKGRANPLGANYLGMVRRLLCPHYGAAPRPILAMAINYAHHRRIPSSPMAPTPSTGTSEPLSPFGSGIDSTGGELIRSGTHFPFYRRQLPLSLSFLHQARLGRRGSCG
jgi:hypothetical protein